MMRRASLGRRGPVCLNRRAGLLRLTCVRYWLTMGRYYFHVRLGDDVLPGEIGVDVHDVTDVKNILSEVLHVSRIKLSLNWRFEIADETGRIVLTVPLAEIQKTQ